MKRPIKFAAAQILGNSKKQRKKTKETTQYRRHSVGNHPPATSFFIINDSIIVQSKVNANGAINALFFT